MRKTVTTTRMHNYSSYKLRKIETIFFVIWNNYMLSFAIVCYRLLSFVLLAINYLSFFYQAFNHSALTFLQHFGIFSPL